LAEPLPKTHQAYIEHGLERLITTCELKLVDRVMNHPKALLIGQKCIFSLISMSYYDLVKQLVPSKITRLETFHLIQLFDPSRFELFHYLFDCGTFQLEAAEVMVTEYGFRAFHLLVGEGFFVWKSEYFRLLMALHHDRFLEFLGYGYECSPSDFREFLGKCAFKGSAGTAFLESKFLWKPEYSIICGPNISLKFLEKVLVTVRHSDEEIASIVRKAFLSENMLVVQHLETSFELGGSKVDYRKVFSNVSLEEEKVLGKVVMESDKLYSRIRPNVDIFTKADDFEILLKSGRPGAIWVLENSSLL
jgi:hypothetical protein